MSSGSCDGKASLLCGYGEAAITPPRDADLCGYGFFLDRKAEQRRRSAESSRALSAPGGSGRRHRRLRPDRAGGRDVGRAARRDRPASGPAAGRGDAGLHAYPLRPGYRQHARAGRRPARLYGASREARGRSRRARRARRPARPRFLGRRDDRADRVQPPDAGLPGHRRRPQDDRLRPRRRAGPSLELRLPRRRPGPPSRTSPRTGPARPCGRSRPRDDGESSSRDSAATSIRSASATAGARGRRTTWRSTAAWPLRG